MAIRIKKHRKKDEKEGFKVVIGQKLETQ